MGDDDIDCTPLGQSIYHQSSSGLNFYESFANQATGLVVKRGDVVRVQLDEGTNEEEFSIAQVLSIFVNEEDIILTEVRWFYGRNEVNNDVRNRIGRLHPNEIFETQVIQDIPAGSIMGIVSIIGGNLASLSRKRKGGEGQDIYYCRYLYHANEGSTMEPVDTCGIHMRGIMASEYEFAYENGDVDLGGVAPSQSDKYTAAAMRLHVSILPDDLPCRATETETILGHIQDAIERMGENKPLYVSGLPGTGKTACVLSCVRKLKSEVSRGALRDFDFVIINALQLQTPTDAYSVLMRKLSGVRYSAKAALSKLQSYFGSSSSKSDRPVVCLVDELDFLMIRNDNVVYNFFDWPLQKQSGLIVVGIANTMDLPERMSSRVLSRLQAGRGLERMVFTPYTFVQITEILTERLQSADIFEGKSLNMSARTAAATAGDLRTALKICQRAIEIHRDSLEDDERTAGTSKVTLASVQKSVREYRAAPMLSALRLSCQLDKAIITCICKHVNITGHPLITGIEIYQRLSDLDKAIKTKSMHMSAESFDRRVEDFAMPSVGIFNERVDALCERGLLLRSSAGTDSHSHIAPSFQLTTAVPDIVATLKEDTFAQFLPRYGVSS